MCYYWAIKRFYVGGGPREPRSIDMEMAGRNGRKARVVEPWIMCECVRAPFIDRYMLFPIRNLFSRAHYRPLCSGSFSTIASKLKLIIRAGIIGLLSRRGAMLRFVNSSGNMFFHPVCISTTKRYYV